MSRRWAFVSAAYVFAGGATYILMAIARRQMSSVEFDAFAVLWGLGFAGAAVAAVPVEQELTRAVAVDVAAGRRSSPDVRRACRVTLVTAAAVAVITAFAMAIDVFGASAAAAGSIAALVVLVISESLVAIGRGALAGLGRTDSVAVLTVSQATVRVVATVAIVSAGGGAVAAAAGVTAANLVLVTFARTIRRATDRGDTDGRELSLAGIRRLAPSSPARALFAIGTPALAGALSSSGDPGEVGDVLIALSLTSAPVMLAAAIQAVVLPGLATAARDGRREDLATFVRRSVLFNTCVGAVAAVGAAAFGPWAIEVLFGGGSTVGSAALAAMTAGAALLFLSNMLTSVCIANERHHDVSLWWSLGAVTMLAACAFDGSLSMRIAVAVLSGSTVVASGLIAAIRREARTAS